MYMLIYKKIVKKQTGAKNQGKLHKKLMEWPENCYLDLPNMLVFI